MRKHEIAALSRHRCQHCGAGEGQPCVTPSRMTTMPHAGRPLRPSSVESRLGQMLVEAMVDGPALPKKRTRA